MKKTIKVKSGKPLDITKQIELKNKYGIMEIGQYNCRYLTYSEDQTIEVIDTVVFHGITFGIKELHEPRKDYQYICFVVK